MREGDNYKKKMEEGRKAGKRRRKRRGRRHSGDEWLEAQVRVLEEEEQSCGHIRVEERNERIKKGEGS